MKRLKIGFVSDDSLDKPDGVQQYVLTLGEWLRHAGHDVHYLTSTTVRHDIPNIHALSRNIGVRFNGNRLAMPLPASKAGIRQLLAAEQFDVLHVQMPHSPLLASRVVALAAQSTVVVGTFHILPLNRTVAIANRVLAIALRRSLRRFDLIASVSAAAANFAQAYYGIHGPILPNTIDYRRFSQGTMVPSSSQTVLKIVYLGRLVPRKGCQVLLAAVAQLVKNNPAAKLEVIIGGRGPLLPKLQQYVHDHDLQTHVTFAGFISEADKPAFLQSADIAVFPSLGGESFGIVLIEAMAAGAAVLAGDNPGYASVLAAQPEQLFDTNDPPQLAVKLQNLLDDSRLRLDWQQSGQKYAKQFDTAIVGQQWLAVYTEALRKRRG